MRLFGKAPLLIVSAAGLVFARGEEPKLSSTTVLGSSFTVTTSTAPSASTDTWRTVPNNILRAGESLYFVVKWGVVTGGYSTLEIHGMEEVAGRPTYHIVSEANSAGVVSGIYKVHDRNDAWLDAASLTTARYEKRIREGKYRIDETGILDQVNHRFTMHSYRVDKDRYEDKVGPLPPNVLDVLGSLYYVRTLPLEVGHEYTLDVYSGEKVYPLVVKVRKRERVKVPAGKFDCLLVEPLLREPGIFVSKGKKLEVWITDDARRMPVRMRSEVVIGHVAAELVSFNNVPTPH